MVSDGGPLQAVFEIARLEAANLLILPLLAGNRIRQKKIDRRAY